MSTPAPGPKTPVKTPAPTPASEPQYETLKGCLLISIIMLISGAMILAAAYWFGDF